MRKPHGGRLRVALSFPNTYFVGMSNLGLQTVYHLFNADDRVVCERVFLPPRGELASLRRGSLSTLESGTPVRDFDIFAFSVSFEWDYTNVITALRLAGVEPRAERRHPRDPLVVIGGAVTFVNPEPLAPFADVIAAGEGEHLVASLIDAAADPGLADRPAFLRRLASERGFYVPSFYEVDYAGPGRVAAITPKPGTGAPAVVRKAAVKASRRAWIRRQPPSSRRTPSSDRACSSKWCAAAPTSAASAGRVTTTCPCVRSRPSGSCESPKMRAVMPHASAWSRSPCAIIPTSS